VVAGGPSFGQWLDHNRLPGTVVAINDAALRLMCRVHYAVSMDRLWTENRWEALREMRLRQEHPKQFWVRDAAVKNLPEARDLDWVQVFENDNTTCAPSVFPGVLNGTNSGACGLNLAIRLFPRRLWLFGFDMGREGKPYWYDPYPWAPLGKTANGKYKAWAGQLDILAVLCKESGIDVVQVGEKSTLPGFRHMSVQETLECLK
jgi:hypothetical protein